MKKILLFTLLNLFNTCIVYSQEALNGEWTGYLTQHIMGSVSESPLVLNIALAGDKISGIAYIEASEFLTISAKMDFKGYLQGDSIIIQEDKILEGDVLGDGIGWCIKRLVLKLETSENGYQLVGRWSGIEDGSNKKCIPGEVLLEKEGEKFYGTLLDSLTQEKIEGIAFIREKETGKRVKKAETETGVFYFAPVFGKSYHFNLTSNGYYDKIAFMDFTNPEQKKNYSLKKIVAGDITIIDHLQFERSSPQITESSKPSLNEFATFLRRNPNLLLEIAGHTSNEGSEVQNKLLSFNRATAVVNILKARGVNPKMLIPKGYGSEFPLEDNATEEGRVKNRRVEFKILSIK
ncbi:MAG: OmpA family protein [Flammeovirgaceae bacterium]|nr:OmpA family protein [Flammeovirgaceae bacterium]